MRKKENPMRVQRHKYTGNDSGYDPVDTKVLVLPDYIDDTSEAGIYLTSQTTETHDLQVTEGYLVASGSEAFVDWKGNDKERLVPGARIVWAVYAGQLFEGDDGKQYRLVNDTDLAAVRR